MAAHSHHPWPDVSRDAHLRAWDDAAEHIDHKWGYIWEELIPTVRRQLAGQLSLSDPNTLVFAPNVHELVARLLSCHPLPVKVLTTDAEFFSFERQLRRWEEEGWAEVNRVPVEPFESLEERWTKAAVEDEVDLVFFSQVFYNSGFWIRDLERLTLPFSDRKTMVVIDGYHGFMAVPTDLSNFEHRICYLAGGYKYAMSGEGACFLHIPPGVGERPTNTGWFAQPDMFPPQSPVTYAEAANRFWGSTFDPSGLYRMRSVFEMLETEGIGITQIWKYVLGLQHQFLEKLSASDIPLGELVPAAGLDRGSFLSFYNPNAAELVHQLARQQVICDQRSDRLRLGFGIYHQPADIDRLVPRLIRVVEKLG